MVWEVGLVSLPATVPGEDGIRFRPLVCLVMDASGAARAMAPGHPDRPEEALKQAITAARDRPQAPCKPGEPRRVVVDSDRLLALVSPLLPGTLVSQGETPRLAEAVQSLRDHLGGGEGARGLDALTTYFTQDLNADELREFFADAAALYERRPWERIPSDGHLFQVTCLPLGIRGWTCCVIGQNKESYGVIVFDSVDDYERYVEAGEQADAGDETALERFPSYRAINFEPKRALPEALLREIEMHNWPVAEGDAFPTLLLVEPDLVLMPPRTMDYLRMRLLVQTLCAWLDAEPRVDLLWTRPKAPPRRRFRLQVGGMKLPVLIGVTHRVGMSQSELDLGVDRAAVAQPTPVAAAPVAKASPAAVSAASAASSRASEQPLEPRGHTSAQPAPKPPPKVPAALRERVESLMARIDPFCAQHLNSDYRDLIHAAVAALARKRPSPLLTGRAPSWCAGVVHAIGTANFLFDPSQTPHCAPKAIYDHFGVASSTALNHSKKVRDLLDISPFAADWLLPNLLEESPIPWMLEVDGFIVDVRTLPLEIQMEACAKGLIPYVPALRGQGRETGSGAPSAP
ncbi:MAG: DUF6398 domain-containing protein [Cyanobacteriota bacterium]|nr:DUF6398 domain-containing protein [Cyanobacteriota bacterium]